MWFGTRNGLNKFNGNSFEIFWNHADDEQSISSNTIACITEDAEGNLWVGTESGLNKLDKKRKGFKRYYLANEADSVNNKILSLHIDTEGVSWVGTLSGLFIYEPEFLQHLLPPGPGGGAGGGRGGQVHDRLV